jgi:hypothetical protein
MQREVSGGGKVFSIKRSQTIICLEVFAFFANRGGITDRVITGAGFATG